MVIRSRLIRAVSSLALVISAAVGSGCILDPAAADVVYPEVMPVADPKTSNANLGVCCKGDPCDQDGEAPICENYPLAPDPTGEAEQPEDPFADGCAGGEEIDLGDGFVARMCFQMTFGADPAPTDSP